MTGILTFHWADDYGAMLQAYGLKRAIESFGEQVEFIPYAPPKLRGRYWLCPLYAEIKDGETHFRFSLRGFKSRLFRLKPFCKRWICMRRFRRRYLTKKLPILWKKSVSLKKYGVVFVGSDQVWNPAITAGLDDVYLGNIPQKGDCRMVSYAASLGREVLPEGCVEKFSRSIGENFVAVSVRESRTVSYILHKSVVDVIDPVLTLQAEEWRKVAVPPRESGYILIYWTESNEQLLRYAHLLARRLGKKIIQVSFPVGRGDLTGVEYRMETGPAEFVGYVQNASCVLTNSFHGTAFSILMEKPFLVFLHSSSNMRAEDLLKKLGLFSRMKLPGDPLDAEEIWAPVDWEEVRRQLDEERRRAMAFIYHHLEGI